MLKRRRFRRVPRLKGLTFNRLIPNIITVGALSAGLTAIRFGVEGRWQAAVVAIVVAAVLDALDGRMARLLKSASDFGAELDSLSDVIAFGVAPAVVIYLWALSGVEGPGWIAALFFAVCCALRLARFNTSIDKLPPYAYNYFTGVPAPGAAGLAILPMILSFELGPEFVIPPGVVGGWLVLVGAMMVSRLPTFSFKKLKIPQNYVLFILVAAGLMVAGLASAPWRTMLVVAAIYMATLPFASLSYMRLRREAARLQDEAGASAQDDTKDEPKRDEGGDDGGDKGADDGDSDDDEAPRAPHLRPV